MIRILVITLSLLFPLHVLAQEGFIPPDAPVEEESGRMYPPQPGYPIPQRPVPESTSTPQKSPPQEDEKIEPVVKVEESKIYLDFRDTDIREVARVLSKISGVSILVSEDVRASVTLNIEGATWKDALELIMKAYNLAYVEKDNFIIIVTYKKIQEEQDQIPLATKIITVNFVNIEEAKEYLKSTLSKRGAIEADERTNSLIVTDTPDIVEKIEDIVKKLDNQTPQVLIEVIMVERKLEDEWQLGIDWTLEDKNALNDFGTDSIRKITQDLSLTELNTLSISYGKSIFGHAYLTSLMEMWKQDKSVDIVANPKILTLDNIQAKIEIKEEIPFTKVTETDQGSTQSTQFREVGIELNVTPHITADRHIIMDMQTEQSFRTGFTPDNQPIIDTRKSETTMMVLDDETIVIGGLRKKDLQVTVNKIPLLGDIPLLGALFRRYTTEDDTLELLIFVTPRIVSELSIVAEEKMSEQLQSRDTRRTAKYQELQRLPITNFKKLELLPIKPPEHTTDF